MDKHMRPRKIEGLPIEDATKKLHLTITAADVKRGGVRSPIGCAAAVALVREVPGCTKARVHLSRTLILVDGKKWVRYRTPLSLRGEVVSFDRGGTFEPDDYILLPLEPSTRRKRGKARSPATLKRGRPDKKRAPYHMLTGVRPFAPK